MDEEAVVLEVKDKKAKIEIKRSKSCRGCGLCSLNPDGMMVAEIEDTIGVKVGDRVQVEIPDKDFLKAAFILYLVPVIGLITGALIGSKFNPHMSILGGFIGIVLSFVFVRYYDRKMGRQKGLHSRISKVLKARF